MLVSFTKMEEMEKSRFSKENPAFFDSFEMPIRNSDGGQFTERTQT
jgi:hypothetical protein